MEQVIHYEVKEGDKVWLALFAYVQPSFEAKNYFREHLRSFASIFSASWVVSGDFNNFASSDESCGGSGDCFGHMLQFRDRWSECNLLDANFSSSKFTWVCKLHGRVIFQEHLNRVLINIAAAQCFPKLYVFKLPRLFSDHHPILFNINASEIP
ncbi:hypothetical protein V6Z12_A11G188400 [Gossypium hirsutum]